MPQPGISITECPRDAMQGLKEFIPAELKAAYINLLLQVGFDIIDFGSFVSAKAIPQMRDTAAVLKKLDLTGTKSKLLAIVANFRGAEEAVQHDEITYLGFPFSISETFQLRNTNAGISKSFNTLENINALCAQKDKKLRVYLSMGFGNPYGDEWSPEILAQWAEQIISAGVSDIYIADTIGIASAWRITAVLNVLKTFDRTSFGLHLHSTPDSWLAKVEAAYNSGCRKFDSALKGYGGCPMAEDELTGNIATENLVSFLQSQKEALGLNNDKLQEALDYSNKVFG